MTITRADPFTRGYRVRRATLLDLRAVHRLERVIFPRDAYPYPDLVLLFLMPNVKNLKITAPDGELAGFVSGMRVPWRNRAWIVTIGVAPQHQRRGLGERLLHITEQRLRKASVLLTVRAGNTPAIRLYERTGYTTVERKVGYYRDGETGLVMEKHLTETESQ